MGVSVKELESQSAKKDGHAQCRRNIKGSIARTAALLRVTHCEECLSSVCGCLAHLFESLRLNLVLDKLQLSDSEPVPVGNGTQPGRNSGE